MSRDLRNMSLVDLVCGEGPLCSPKSVPRHSDLGDFASAHHLCIAHVSLTCL
jgi:hypothetical protein